MGLHTCSWGAKDLPREGKHEEKIEQWKIDVDPNPHSFRLQLH